MSKPLKNPIQMMEDADGNPQWLREALNEIFLRLPPISPPAPPKTGPSWDPMQLAILHLDPGCVPLSAKNRWYLAAWLKGLAQEMTDGTFDEGDSKEGFRTIFMLGKTATQ